MPKILKSSVVQDEFTEKIAKCFDYEFTGESTFTCWDKPDVGDYQIGLIVGSSGSGKSTLLKEFGETEDIAWDREKSIASNFSSPEEAIDKLSAVGLNSIPTWCKSYVVLSNGEAFRANLARRLKDNASIDEFTSVVDRNVAKSCCVSISKYIRNKGLKNITFASCHRDIVEWLQPDWIFDTDTGELVSRGLVRRPPIKLQIYKSDYSAWSLFKRHHYLSGDLNRISKCFVATWNDEVVAFSANLPLPGRIPPLFPDDNRNKYREHRLVVLPDYQGMGIGTRFSNAIGEYILNNGYRYFSKTAHVRMGEYRNKSPLWRATATNLADRSKSTGSKSRDWHHYRLDTKRICYSHEYLGEPTNPYRVQYEEWLKSRNVDSKLTAERYEQVLLF